MQAVGPEAAFLFLQDEKQSEQKGLSVDLSQNMWEYRNRDRFNGIPVQQQARKLLVNSTQQLDHALQPISSIGTWVGYISPQKEDEKYLSQYNAIKQKQVQGKIYIIAQDKQFCPSLNKFLLFITYDEVQMGLNPRYKHLKEVSDGN